jgi:cytoskeleton protein RodZ
MSMGAYLRSARRRRRVSIERAAEDTKIRPDFLMRMESDEFDFLAPAYVRGFLRTYARFLHVDPEPLLEEFDNRHGAPRPDTQQIVALERRQNSVPREPRARNNWAIAASVAAVVLILLAILGVTRGNEPTPAGSTAANSSPTPSPSPSPSPKLKPKPTPSVTPIVVPSPGSGIIAPGEGLVVEINAVDGECWVQATVDGAEIYSGIIQPGTGQIFSANETMELVLGLPSSVELVVNGENLGEPGGDDPITLDLPADLAQLDA